MSHAELLTPRTVRRPREPAPSGTAALATLIDEIDAACADTDGPRGGRILAALRNAAAQTDLLTRDQRAPQNGCYARHVLHSDPVGRFTVVSIVWSPGQFSPTHAHHTWCAYAVHENALEETLYAWDDASATALPKSKDVRRTGYSCFAQAGLDQIHRLGNSSAVPAISIHVYGVEREQVCTHVNRVVQIA
jgi:predicted metal-dependent enzyme (double-stranded beta helix superfamily)